MDPFADWGLRATALAAAAVIAWGVATWMAARAVNLGLLVRPQARSSHLRPTPHGGGLGVVLGFSLVAIWWGIDFPGLRSVAVLTFPLAVMGLLDDLRHMSIVLRLSTQTLVCGALLWGPLAGLPAITFGDTVPLEGYGLSVILLLAAVWWVNLFNFMDGIDGLAGGQAISMALLAATMIVSTQADAWGSPLWWALLAIAASTSGFLMQNWSPARIFMGDVGSTWLGAILFAIAGLTIAAGWMTYAAWLILAAVFITDATVTLATRVARGEPWYRAHRDHAYQKLVRRFGPDRTRAHRRVSLLAMAVNGLWLGPLAWLSLEQTAFASLWLGLAYVPLVVAAVWIGAGRSDKVSPATSA
ncbi:glycosyl transferase family 4 [Betaproteobacteria bacterium SCN1]|jgi:Fuc2NAc and GlcNAc transferase|nr:glycosyl transferase family 4 [Betaproteobacteria bacterium SCN1]